MCDKTPPGEKLFPKLEPGNSAPTSTESVAKWVAGGFTLLAGLLGWFGIKEGVLDRMLLQYPREALWVFVLVGLGVIIAVCSAMLSSSQLGNMGVAIIGSSILIILCARMFPAFQRSYWGSVDVGDAAIAIIVLIAIALLFLFGKRSPSAIAVLLIIAVVSLSCGLYGAAKLAVISKRYHVGIEVVASVSRDPADASTASVDLAVSAGGLPPDHVLRVSLMDPTDGGQVLGEAFVAPDVGGSLSKSVDLRVPASLGVAEVRVSHCRQVIVSTRDGQPAMATEMNPSVDTSSYGAAGPTVVPAMGCSDSRGDVYATFGVEAGTKVTVAAPLLAASVIPGSGSTASVLITGGGLPAHSVVKIQVAAGPVEVASASVRADSAGSLSWQATIPTTPDTVVTARANVDDAPGITAQGELAIPPAT